MWLSAQSLPGSLSATILATLAVMLAGAVGAFGLLARRVTLRRNELALNDWAAEQGAGVARKAGGEGAIAQLEMLASFHPLPRLVIHNRRWTLAEFTSDPPAEAKGKTPRWRVLAIAGKSPHDWAPTGLRPVVHTVSLIDLLPMSSFPSLAEGERFMLFGSDSGAAQALADSAAQRLLPADIGLLLNNRVMVLDFSSRQFDPIEFERLLALANQLVDYLARTEPKLAAGTRGR